MELRINKKSAAAAALLALGLVSARAEGLYVGGDVGTPRFGNAVNGIGAGSDISRGTGYNLYGGYVLTPQLAVEGGLFSLGRINDANGSVKTRGVYLDAVGRYSFAPQWSLVGSAGLAQGRFSSTLGDDSSPALKVGLGLQYAINPLTSVRLKVDRYHFVNAYGAKPNLGEVSLGVQVGF